MTDSYESPYTVEEADIQIEEPVHTKEKDTQTLLDLLQDET